MTVENIPINLYESMLLDPVGIEPATWSLDGRASDLATHYENTPILINRKFYLQNLKIFRQKTLIFFKFLLKT